MLSVTNAISTTRLYKTQALVVHQRLHPKSDYALFNLQRRNEDRLHWVNNRNDNSIQRDKLAYIEET